MELVVRPIHRIATITRATTMGRRGFEPCGRVVDAHPFEWADTPCDSPLAVAPREVVDIAKARNQIVLGTAVLAWIVVARLPVGLTLRPPGDEVELIDQHVAHEMLTPRVAREQTVEDPRDVLVSRAGETAVLVGGLGPVAVAHHLTIATLAAA